MITVGKVFDQHREEIITDVRENPKDPNASKYLMFLEEASLFDFSALKFEPEVQILGFEDTGTTLNVAIPVSSCFSCLPFVSNFILIKDSSKYYEAVSLEEWDPLKIGGIVYINDIAIAHTLHLSDASPLEVNRYHVISFHVPPNSVFRAQFDMQEFATELSKKLIFCFSVFEKLAEYYYTRIEEGQSKPFYIKMPHEAKARKIAGKPIIIFLSERKSKSDFEEDMLKRKYPKYKIMHSFPVRGHWRKLHDPNSRGKDRMGVYNQLGFTWVRECIKGSGTLIKRPYVLLPGGSSKGEKR